MQIVSNAEPSIGKKSIVKKPTNMYFQLISVLSESMQERCPTRKYYLIISLHIDSPDAYTQIPY